MRYALSIIALLALHVHAAPVYPDAATNYCFVTPWHPSTIKGYVMCTNLANGTYRKEYLTPRTEDADWILEAYSERQLLCNARNTYYSGTNNTPLVSFNSRGVYYTPWSAAVEDCDYDNLRSSSYYYDSQWLDPDTELRADMDYLELPDKLPVETNVFYVTTIDASSNPDASSAWWPGITTNATSYVTTSLTNGTQSVHTNQWTVTRFWPRVSVLSTNVYTYSLLDYCQASTSTHFPRLMVNDVGTTNNLPEVVRYNYSRRWTEGLYHTYDSFRRTTRLADYCQSPSTNKFVKDQRYTPRENGIPTWHAYTSVATNPTMATVFAWGRYNASTNSYISALIPRTFWVPYETRFESQLATTGGVDRVEIEAAYLLVSCGYDLTVNSESKVSFVGRSLLVPVPSGAYRLTTQTGEDPLLAEIYVEPMSLAVIAFGYFGVDIPPTNPLDRSLTVTTSYGGNFRQSWSVTPEQAVFIYKITPYSKFASW